MLVTHYSAHTVPESLNPALSPLRQHGSESDYLRAECLFTIMTTNDQLRLCCLNYPTFIHKASAIGRICDENIFYSFSPLFEDTYIKGQVSDLPVLNCLGLNALVISIFMKIKQSYTTQWVLQTEVTEVCSCQINGLFSSHHYQGVMATTRHGFHSFAFSSSVGCAFTHSSKGNRLTERKRKSLYSFLKHAHKP